MTKKKKDKTTTAEQTDLTAAQESGPENAGPDSDETHQGQPGVEAEAPVQSVDGDVQAVAAAQNDATAAEETEPANSEAVLALEKELAQVRQEAERNLENWQRTAAELANFKRRQEEQMKLQRDRIKTEVLEGVISALDDMDLAFQNLPAELDGQLVGWVEGFRLVQRKLDRILDEQNVMLINTEGQFDPNFHEAISYEENDEHESDEIIAELRKGYQIGNRVIRPALVRVAR